MKHRITIALFCALTLSGCLARELRVPTQRHALEADIVLQRCELGGYYEHPCGEMLLEDLKTTAEQAALIHSIVIEDGDGD